MRCSRATALGVVVAAASLALACAEVNVSARPGLTLSTSRIVVVPFGCGVAGVGEVVADSITERLVEDGVRVIGWMQFAATGAQSGLQIIPGSSREELARVAEAASVDFILAGNVSASMGASGFLYGGIGGGSAQTFINGASAQLIDVRTGEVVVAVSYNPAEFTERPADIGERIAENIIKKTR
jgi:hypothetical protein